MSLSTEQVTPSTDLERLVGRVKWFNTKAGYGFITVTDGNTSGTDYFVHHSAVDVNNKFYKYLVQGEYVEFSLVKTTEGPHEYHAVNVTGIKGGKLMYETRHEFKLARTTYRSTDQPSVEAQVPVAKQPRVSRMRGEGPRATNSSGDADWKTVSKPTVKRNARPVSKKVVSQDV
jgi:CspA family cold shock protein